jgi:hypothetical protein
MFEAVFDTRHTRSTLQKMDSSLEIVDPCLLYLFSFVKVEWSVFKIVLEKEEYIPEMNSRPILSSFECMIRGQTPSFGVS